MRTLGLIVALTLAAGCKKKTQSPAEPASAVAQPVPEPVAEPDAPVEDPIVTQLKANFARVHFAFDSAALEPGSLEVLSENAKILQENPDVQVRIEGHADERGTVDYNLALASQRAQKVFDSLTQMGVSEKSLSTVSYGEEKPLLTGASEHAFSKNRRAEFRVTRNPRGDVDSSNDAPVE